MSTVSPSRTTSAWRFIDAVLFVGKTGIPWRDLPERFGDGVWKRFGRWSRAGRWPKRFDAFQAPDREWLILDSTVIRAHPCAVGAKKVRRDRGTRGAGVGPQPRGGGGTTIHVRVNGLGLPTRLLLSPGPDADITHAGALLTGAPATAAFIADKGYDEQELMRSIEARGAEAVIPSWKNRAAQRDLGTDRCKDRNRIERFWAKVQQYRRVATRY